ncbi:MAG: M48 family metalloprotease [Candidatus Nomurabacteria bacterium]|jgi:heat shock protein HtpX|nr:M48 family metalloprotease [Candidatus Nomurabacteria bacterium]
MYGAIAANKRNTAIFIAVFVALIGGIGWVVGYISGDMTLGIWCLTIAAIYAFTQYFLASKLAVAMTGAKKIDGKQDNPRLYHIVDTLAITVGIPTPEIYVINDPAPNAFATGRDPKHAIIGVTTGLLDTMDDNELTGVIAHEMSHIQNYDIRLSAIVFGLVCLIGYISDIGFRVLVGGGDRDKNPITLVVGIVAMILAPIVALAVQMSVSRQREYLADSSAVMITRYPEGMISALKKLGEYKQPMAKQNPSMNMMFISDPDKKKGFMSRMFSTHPPIEDRIARLEQNQGKF